MGTQFERIRAVFQGAVSENGSGKPKEPRQPLTVIAAADVKTFESLLPPEWSGESARRPSGLFVRTRDRNYAIVRADLRGEQAHQLVYHEYFHLYEALNLPPLPLWLSDGLAEFHAGTIVRGDRMIRGSGMLRHKLLLRGARLIPLPELLATRRDDPLYTHAEKSGLFYAQAWALVHMLMLDEGAGSTKIAELMSRLREGVPADQAQAEVFGNLAGLQKQLALYVKQASYPVLQLEGQFLSGPPEFSSRALASQEASLLLGEFYLMVNRLEDALGKAETVIRTAPSSPNAYDLLGQVLLRRGDTPGARQAFSTAAELGSTDWRTYYMNAALLAQSASQPGEIRDVEKLLRRAVALNPDSELAAGTLAGMLIDTGSDPEFALRLAQRVAALEPGNANHQLQLARAFLRNGRRAEALASANRALELAATDSFRLEMQAFLKNIEAPVLVTPAPTRPAGAQEITIWVKDEAAEEALRRWKAERDAVAHIQTFVSGRVLATSCGRPPRLNVEMETETGTLKLAAANSGMVAYYVTEGAPPKKFNPCRDLRGRVVDVVYRPVRKGPTAGEILAVEMHP